MRGLHLLAGIRMLFAYGISIPAIAMPYAPRTAYMNVLAVVTHAPFKAFGRIARFFIRTLNIRIITDEVLKTPLDQSQPDTNLAAGKSALILYSGGTDSTCAAALAAERFSEVHLVTFWERATRNSPIPTANAKILKKHFPETSLVTQYLQIDELVRFFSYERYPSTILKHGILALATPGYSSLAWHTSAIIYCREHDIKHVMDGLTRELMHFPGHMDAVVEQIRDMYAAYGISYSNPVRSWETPPDQQYLDKVIVGHADIGTLIAPQKLTRKTTGTYLYDRGIFPSPNIKGSPTDFLMQHDCYPFVLYNMIAFWIYLAFEPYEIFCSRISNLMADKIVAARRLIDDRLKNIGVPTHI